MFIEEGMDDILDEAEAVMRESGFGGLQMDLLATSLGLDSIRQWFDSEEDIAYWVTRRYVDRFFQQLGGPEDYLQPAEHFVRHFQAGLDADGRACLCGSLQHERDRLPMMLLDLLDEFRTRCEEWLASAVITSFPCQPSLSREFASICYDALEGAMGFAARNRDGRPLWRAGDTMLAMMSV